jgi:hypothetical protein
MAVLLLALVWLVFLAGIIVWKLTSTDNDTNASTSTDDDILPILFAVIVIGMSLLIMAYTITPHTTCR